MATIGVPGVTIDADVFDSDPVAALRDMFAALYPSNLPALLNALGACAGLAAQAAVWRELVIAHGCNPGDVFVRLQPVRGGPLHYDGEAASRFLLGAGPDHLGFLDLAAASLASPAELPDVRLLARHVANTIGTEAFGTPRLPSFLALDERPRAALARSWPRVAALLAPRRQGEWPALLGAVAYTIIRANRAALAPRLALTILLEAAVPMSKLDPASVPGSGIVIPPVAGWTRGAAEPGQAGAIEVAAREAMPLRLPSLVRALGHLYRPAIAFVNLGGPGCNDLVAEDHAAFGRLFGAHRRIATLPVPCDVLFLYCRFDASGRIAGERASFRALVAETRARIVVVATELPGRPPLAEPAFAALVSRGAHPPVNLVLTVARKGELFRHFFRSLFERMWSGAAMPVAWAQLSPETVNPLHDVPAVLCMMEAGSVAFSGQAA